MGPQVHGDGARLGPAGALVDVVLAFDFATRRHIHQRRKGSGREPYVNHLAEVALLVAQATDGKDPALVVAAVLHDTVEDTGTRPQEIEQLFGAEVRDLVMEVTDDKRLPEERRKQLQVETAASKTPRARLLKIADKTSNLRSLARDPPPEWGCQRRRRYVLWAREVVDRCRGVSPVLEQLFDSAWREAALRVGVET